MPELCRLIEDQVPRLRRYARALTRNPERADDLVQDTVERALAKQHLWQPGTDLRAWLFTLMHNQNVNSVQRNMREGTAVDVEQLSSALIATTDPTASRQLFELERALGQLPVEQREAILLVGLEGLAYEEAAAILGVPIGTVRSRLSRGRDTLRRLMDMTGEDAIARSIPIAAAGRTVTPDGRLSTRPRLRPRRRSRSGNGSGPASVRRLGNPHPGRPIGRPGSPSGFSQAASNERRLDE
jgi:RNA polymerase sigma-70 factor (ECF subfamily)